MTSKAGTYTHIYCLTNNYNGKRYYSAFTNNNPYWMQSKRALIGSNLQRGRLAKSIQKEIDLFGRHWFTIDILFSSGFRPEAYAFLDRIKSAPGFFDNSYNRNYTNKMRSEDRLRFMENNVEYITDSNNTLRASLSFTDGTPEVERQKEIQAAVIEVTEVYDRPEVIDAVHKKIRETCKSYPHKK